MQDQPGADIPEIGRNRGMEIFIVWLLLEVLSIGYVFGTVQNYNPEGNGLYNAVEATLLSQAWIKLSASLLVSILLSVAFGIGIIASRLRTIARINRAGHLAILEELRRGR